MDRSDWSGKPFLHPLTQKNMFVPSEAALNRADTHMKDDENLQIFVDEALEHLLDFEQNILSIEQSGQDVDSEVVNTVFRAVHTIKGGAGLLGLHNINVLAHKMENLLGLIREHSLVPNAEIINFLLQAGDALKSMVNNVQDSESMDVSDHVQALDTLLHNVSPAQEPAGKALKQPARSSEQKPSDNTPPRCPLPLSQKIYDQASVADKTLYVLQYPQASTSDVDQEEQTLVDQLSPYGHVLDARREKADNVTSVYLLFSSVLAPSDMELLPAVQVMTLWTVQPDLSLSPVKNGEKELSAVSEQDTHPVQSQDAAEDSLPDSQSSGSPLAPTDKTPAKSPVEGLSASETRSEGHEEHCSLRVTLSVLDTLMTLAGELVLGRNQLLQSLETEDLSSVQGVSQRVDQITSEMQDAVMQTRMQPIGRLFTRFPRIVRDLARQLHKEVDLRVTGEDVEIDRSILEVLYDPLTHLIRNAVDHGIEVPEVRRNKGKSEAGRLSLRAFHETGKIIVQVGDDGAGLDAEKISSAAVHKKLISQEQASTLSRQDKIHLIFLPGFSLSEKVSEISGRGVGMDVVKTNLDSIGGQIWLESKPDQGTLVRIALTLTLAVFGGVGFTIAIVSMAGMREELEL